jgi:hypothetical protein
MWRKVRVSILLLILAIVGQQAILKDGPQIGSAWFM